MLKYGTNNLDLVNHYAIDLLAIVIIIVELAKTNV